MANSPEDTVPRATEGDVLRIVAEIRSAAERQRVEGVFTVEDTERKAAERIRSWIEEIPIHPALQRQFHRESYDWNIDTDYEIRSHRTGALVFVLVLVKKIVRPFVKLYTDHILNRQAQINLYFFNVIHKAAVEQVRLEGELALLRDRLEAIERRQNARSDRG
jgi:hypothetical protein